MRVVLQRVTRASVRVDRDVVGAIGPGLLALVGAARGDSEADADWLADKTVGLRVFADDAGQMNRSLLDTGGALLVVSQFTLLADCRKGRRPSFGDALEPAAAAVLVERFAARARACGVPVQTGRFGAHMEVELCNDGPVTMLLERASARKSVGPEAPPA